MRQNAVIFYSRLPTKNLVGKTRIGKQIDNQSIANKLARSLILDMLHEYLPTKDDTYDFVWYYKGNLGAWTKNYELPTINYIEQLPGELSIHHIHKLTSKTYKKIIIVGSDIPLINKSVILDTLNMLNISNVAISPTEDNGYGLIAADNYYDLYSNITNWESRSEGYNLLYETKEIIRNKNLTLHTNPTVFDIDYIEDVQKLWSIINQNGSLKNDYSYLERTYKTIAAIPPLSGKKWGDL